MLKASRVNGETFTKKQIGDNKASPTNISPPTLKEEDHNKSYLDLIKSKSISFQHQKTTKMASLPLPAVGLGATIQTSKDLMKFQGFFKENNLPCVFVSEISPPRESSESYIFAGDFTDHLLNNPSDELSSKLGFLDELRKVKSIIVLFPDGTSHSVDLSMLSHSDPKGTMVCALLKLDKDYFLSKQDEAEIRVKVAAAFTLNAFGISRPEMAQNILSPVQEEFFSIGTHRTFIEAVQASNIALTLLMLAWGADINAPSEEDNLLAIDKAGRRNDNSMVELLKKNGALAPEQLLF